MSGVASRACWPPATALFLAVVALGLDLLARHSHRRSELYRTAGFTFDGHLDAWECPEGERLHRIETDMQQRLARYRARAHVCNACPRKGDCTDSDTGRELTRALDPWPHSEVGRFHRGIAVAIVCFGILMIGAGAALNHGSADLAVLGGALLCSTRSRSTSSPTSAPPRVVSRGRRASEAAMPPCRRRRLAEPPTARGGPIDGDLVWITGAERVGFEPTRRFNPPTRFPSELLKPLGHLSGVAEV